MTLRPRAVALAGLALFLALVALQHPLRPDLPPAEHFVSEYARGSTQPLQVMAFLGWAAAMAAAAVLATRTQPSGRLLARGLTVAALALATGGTVVAAVFATQTVGGVLPEDVPRTDAGRLHDFGTLLIFAGLIPAAVASLRLVRSTRYRWTVAGLGVLLLAIVPALVAAGIHAPGIGQRGFILVACTWLWRFAAEARPAPPRP